MADLGGMTSLAGGRYRLERVLGSGGMGVVALCTDRALWRPVAVKVLADHLSHDQPFGSRFIHEARIAARLGHPNIVQVYDVGQEAGRPYIVMEYVSGPTVADVLEHRGRLPARQAVDLAVQVCAGLDHAHAAGVIHRDVNPRNLLLRTDGVVKIADFGIARELDGTQVTQAGLIMGTVGYVAPELVTGEHTVSAAADLYSLGTVIYTLLTGSAPFQATSAIELVMKQREQGVRPPGELVDGVSPGLDAVVLRCLDGDPRRRPPSAATVAAELVAAMRDRVTEPIHGRSGVQPNRAPASPAHDGSTRPLTVSKRRRSSPRVWAAVLAVLVVVGFFVGLALTRAPGTPLAPSRSLPRGESIVEPLELVDRIGDHAG